MEYENEHNQAAMNDSRSQYSGSEPESSLEKGERNFSSSASGISAKSLPQNSAGYELVSGATKSVMVVLWTGSERVPPAVSTGSRKEFKLSSLVGSKWTGLFPTMLASSRGVGCPANWWSRD